MYHSSRYSQELNYKKTFSLVESKCSCATPVQLYCNCYGIVCKCVELFRCMRLHSIMNCSRKSVCSQNPLWLQSKFKFKLRLFGPYELKPHIMKQLNTVAIVNVTQASVVPAQYSTTAPMKSISAKCSVCVWWRQTPQNGLNVERGTKVGIERTASVPRATRHGMTTYHNTLNILRM